MIEVVEVTLVEAGDTLVVEVAAMIATNRRKNLEGNQGSSLSVLKSTFKRSRPASFVALRARKTENSTPWRVQIGIVHCGLVWIAFIWEYRVSFELRLAAFRPYLLFLDRESWL
jgi:hypothetical protein